MQDEGLWITGRMKLMPLANETAYSEQVMSMSDHSIGLVLAAIETLKAEQAQLRQDLFADQAQLRADLTGEMGRLGGAMTRLGGEMTHLGGEMTRLNGEMTRLRVDLMGRMERLEDNLTAIRDDIATNYGTVEQAQRANDNTRAELRSLNEVVMLMQRQMQRLQSDVRTLKGDP